MGGGRRNGLFGSASWKEGNALRELVHFAKKGKKVSQSGVRYGEKKEPSYTL